MRHIPIAVAVLFIISFTFLACGEGESDVYTSTTTGDGNIAWANIQEGIEKAQSENKKLLVYVHTDWCSWCKRMEEETFADESVAAYMNDNFVPVTLDAESEKIVRYNGQEMSEEQVAQSLGVEGFPTHIFLTSNGEPLTIMPGYMPPDRFINVLSFIAEDHYLDTEWEDYLEQQAS